MKTIDRKLQVANHLASKANDGASIDINLNKPKSGYMVSIHGHGEIVTERPISNIRILEWVSKQWEFAALKDYYFGIWKDTDKYYLDISINCYDIHEAKEIGRMHDQLAIWDVENQKEIRL